MPRRNGQDEEDDDKSEEREQKNPRRATKGVSYAEEKNNNGEEEGDGGDDPMDVDAFEGEDNPASEEDEEAEASARRRSSRAKSAKSNNNEESTSKENIGVLEGRRTSARSTKFKSSMKEPSDKSIRDLLKDTNIGGGSTKDSSNNKNTNRRRKGSAAASLDGGGSNSEVDEKPSNKKQQRPAKRSQKQTQQNKQKQQKQTQKKKTAISESPHKSPARKHKQHRLSIGHHNTGDNSDSVESDDSSAVSEVEDGEEEEPFKVQRILASRTEKRNAWAKICAKINTAEIDYGSRWVQDPVDENDETFEERFLVKWRDLSYLHISWETERDLLELVDGAKTNLSTFFRKSNHGLLFSSDERCDGGYFDPAWTQVDRILTVHIPNECPMKSVQDEDAITMEELGIVLDKTNPDFENGLGREFLIKWGNCNYTESTYEFERDLILNEVDYKDHLKSFHRRRKKPTKEQAKKLQKEGEAEYRLLYKSVFGDKSTAKEEDGVAKYQQQLQVRIFRNGGQLRDYQAEGVSWMMSNYINDRSSILADEMGLGKTIQTASFINLLATELKRPGPFLIIAPLSTLAHWQREFEGWTELNTIVYHGSAKDRETIREFEFAHDSYRPTGGVGFNQLYLRKCLPKKKDSTHPWMVEVVITTPELLCADDYSELTAVKWECLVVDEAHRLKNYASKLAVNLRDSKFQFTHKVLLTGTPIQNTMQELFALLHFINPELFSNCDDFMAKYGDMKSKEKIDELHEEIRPYILRRLKEDVEKSVPPKEETVIEVELTIAQKQYYRALYEKNVKFLHKNKKKALDGPSLNNLAMQLRKCCNHLFLLNGIEEEFRAKQKSEGNSLSEADILASASGKLVLLDKLLPRLKENGHRILMFSQFKIMLDVLEDYLQARDVKFERIDGSITGKKRQQAIDRFQAPDAEGKSTPFIMLLSTRAGGVGINLTAADTCIIFDSDWNPQNDLQAQARCHRIGQTKSVKVYRLLTRKTYEMQMFHMSSLKMGLDQAVLSGFESSSSGEGALSKEEVERLLRHGAYGIFSEDNEAESNDFVQQDIDTILERRSRTVVHENTGSGSAAAGGTFSKARFTAPKATEPGKKSVGEDVDIEDPDFWKKMVGEAKFEEDDDDLAGKRRKRTVMNYNEGNYEKKVEASLLDSDAEDDDEDSADDESYDSGDDDQARERFRWGGNKPSEWKKDEAKKLLNLLHAHGYGTVPWSSIRRELGAKNGHDDKEVQRMCWSTLLLALCEIAEEDATQSRRRAERAAEKKRDAEADNEGGVLAGQAITFSGKDQDVLIQKCFGKLWVANSSWAASVLEDALKFAKSAQPRSEEVLKQVLDSTHGAGVPPKPSEISSLFVQNVWPCLKSRGWKAELLTEGDFAGKTQYTYEGKQYHSPEAVLTAAGSIHTELANMVDTMLSQAQSSRQKSMETEAKLKEKHLAMKAGVIDVKVLTEFLRKYAPLQLLFDRKSIKKLHLSSRRMMHACTFLHTATTLVRLAESSPGEKPLLDKLAALIVVDKRLSLPHPLWTTKHDAVLIQAIAKHGWIDNDSSCRQITKDSSIKWGFPFDSEQSDNEAGNGNKTSRKDELINNLRDTANRAAALLNDHSDTLEEVKGFNQNLVIRAYCLVRDEDHDDSDNETGNDGASTSRWVVDDAALLASTGLESAESQEFVELPTKRDLCKRAKMVLSRASTTAGSQPQDIQEDDPTAGTEGEECYCVLDQSERCNVLLAEILKAIVKAPYPKAQNAMKLLCSIATQETEKRVQSIVIPSTDDQDHNKLRATRSMEQMSETIKNIALVKKNLRQSRLAKNVLRVILGIEIVKHPKGGNFPVERPVVGKSSIQKQQANETGIKTKKEDNATGDRALARAMAKCFERNGGGPGRVLPEGHSTDLELTAIETLLISVICSQGLPIWTENASSLLSETVEEGNMSEDNFALCWVGLGNVLARAAKEWHEMAALKVEACQNDYQKYQGQEAETQPKVRARKALANAIKIEEVKELAASQAADYASDPEILAKKTIMLIERLRRKMGHNAGGHTKPSHKVNHWLGPKVFDFLSTNLRDWARHLDIVDSHGRTLSYTAADFYHDLPVDERDKVEVTTHLNKQDCRQLLIQITVLSRLRSFFVKYSKEELLPRIDMAATTCRINDPWETQPSWWRTKDPPYLCDALLLESLVEFGMGGVLDNARCFGGADDSDQLTLKELGWTKAMVQQRANQLARELHNLERGDAVLREIEQRRQKSGDGGMKSQNGVKGGKQTALDAFFSRVSTGGASSKASNVLDVFEIEDVTAGDEKDNREMPAEVEMVGEPSEGENNGQHEPAGAKEETIQHEAAEPEGVKFDDETGDAVVTVGIKRSPIDESGSPGKKPRTESSSSESE